MFKKLTGYRTYICAGVMGVTTILYYTGILDPNAANAIFALFGTGAIAGIRASIDNQQ